MIDLDAMIRLAGQHARTILIEQKQNGLQPVFMFQTAGDEIGFIAAGVDMDSGDAKQAMAEEVRVILRERGAIAYSFVSEAWMAQLPADAPLPRNVRDRPDRIEVVYAVAFDAEGGARSASWRMVRGPGDVVTNLIKLREMSGEDLLSGRFAHLLVSRA